MDELQEIKMHIYTFRGRQVLLDRDLAKMYGVEVKRLNESVKRNIKRFPEDFAFILSSDEFLILKSQNATSSWGGDRRPPRVFTEQGVLKRSFLHQLLDGGHQFADRGVHLVDVVFGNIFFIIAKIEDTNAMFFTKTIFRFVAII